MSNKSIQSVRGMNDLLPDACQKWEAVELAIREVVRLYGYQEIRTPILEKTELFNRSIGEETDIVGKEMYTFYDRNQDSLTLRPEATASCVRAGIEHGLLYNQTQRLWYVGPMFRHERPQKGRYRQFHQFGIEALGWQGPDIDAELLILGDRLWSELGLTDIKLEINSLGSQTNRANYVDDLCLFLERYRNDLDQSSQRRLGKNPLRILDSKDERTQSILEEAPDISDYLDENDIRHFNRLLKYLDDSDIDYRVNTRLVRGLDYYTGCVFEWTTPLLGAQNTFCGGGRYDGLVEDLGGSSMPAAGFACGLERLVQLHEKQTSNDPPGVDVWVIMLGDSAEAAGFRIAEQLRADRIQTVCNCGGGGLRKQLRRADKNNARYAVIIGDEELKAGKCIVKCLQSDAQQSLVLENSLSEFLLSELETD